VVDSTQVEKGDYVVAIAAGSGAFAQGYGYVSYKAGEELKVTSKGKSFLNVQRGRGGRTFRVGYNQVRPVARRIGEVPEGAIAADDPRIAWLFEDAARLADRLGFCGEFDQLADALGAPGRIRTFSIVFEPADGVKLTAKVEARSRRLAEQRILGSVAAEPVIKAIEAAS
jgi:hypothetical protein